MRSRFLSSGQERKELSEYVQELRSRLAAMQLGPLPEDVRVDLFMEGLRNEVARTKVFHVHPSTFEEAVDIALNAEFNSKADRYGTHWHAQNLLDRAESMDLSHAGDEEAELQTVKQQRNYVDVTRVEVQGISSLTVHCLNSDRITRVVIPLQLETWYGAGKCRLQ